jgi:hypothetical protein
MSTLRSVDGGKVVIYGLPMNWLTVRVLSEYPRPYRNGMMFELHNLRTQSAIL